MFPPQWDIFRVLSGGTFHHFSFTLCYLACAMVNREIGVQIQSMQKCLTRFLLHLGSLANSVY